MLPVLALLVGRRRFAWWWLPALVGSCVATVDLPLLSLPRLRPLRPVALSIGSRRRRAVDVEPQDAVVGCLCVCSCAVTLPNALETHLDDAEHALISMAANS